MRSTEGKKTFGSSRLADFSSTSPSLKGIQGVFEYRNNQWVFINLDREIAATTKKAACTIEQDTKIAFGDSTISFEISKREYSLLHLLDQIDSQPLNGTEKPFQFYMVKKAGAILETRVLGTKDKFIPATTPTKVVISPVSGREWQRTEHDDMEIVQRTVYLVPAAKIPGFDKSQVLDPENRRAIYFCLGLALLLIMIAVVTPKSENSPQALAERVAEQEIDLSQFKDQKKKKKPEEKKPTSGQKQAGAQGDENKQQGKMGNSIKSITGGRLSSILGKISTQAARSRHVVLSKGVSANQESGKALAGIGKVEKSGRNWEQEGLGGSLRVSTLGVGGGKSGNAFGGLTGAGVGKGNVGLIEDESEVSGGLDREVIAQYIRSQLGQIRYCYERQLSATPDLYGKVEIKFDIIASGRVENHKINESTLKSANVEGCIMGKVKGWKFPEPKNGTRVIVKYPFLFKSTN